MWNSPACYRWGDWPLVCPVCITITQSCAACGKYKLLASAVLRKTLDSCGCGLSWLNFSLQTVIEWTRLNHLGLPSSAVVCVWESWPLLHHKPFLMHMLGNSPVGDTPLSFLWILSSRLRSGHFSGGDSVYGQNGSLCHLCAVAYDREESRVQYTYTEYKCKRNSSEAVLTFLKGMHCYSCCRAWGSPWWNTTILALCWTERRTE